MKQHPGGITSSEALGMCVPVVSYGIKSSHNNTNSNSNNNGNSILQFAVAQIKTLGSEFEDEMIVYNSNNNNEISSKDLTHYIDTAISLANSANIPNNTVSYVNNIRIKVCINNYKLFSKELFSQVALEWYQLFRKVMSIFHLEAKGLLGQ